MSDDTDTLKATMQAVARAIAEQRLKLSEATVEDLRQAARGEIDTDEVVRRIYQRIGEPPPAALPYRIKLKKLEIA